MSREVKVDSCSECRRRMSALLICNTEQVNIVVKAKDEISGSRVVVKNKKLEK